MTFTITRSGVAIFLCVLAVVWIASLGAEERHYRVQEVERLEKRIAGLEEYNRIVGIDNRNRLTALEKQTQVVRQLEGMVTKSTIRPWINQ